MLCRCILSDWAKQKYPALPKVLEGEYNEEQIIELNNKFYNVYFFPNHPSVFHPGDTINGTHIDQFSYVFVDMDLKDGFYKTKESFFALLKSFSLQPTFIVDSGNGVHAYWQVSDLDAINFLKLQRRLMRYFNTDPAVAKICQIMRYPGTNNTKDPDNIKLSMALDSTDNVYTCEDLSISLPLITREDETYCQDHYDKTYNKTSTVIINDNIPPKFMRLLKDSDEVKKIWTGNTEDRSVSDYRLGHIMFASGFTRDEAMSVLANTSKATARAPTHRVNYALGIVDKIWTYELAEDKSKLNLSQTVRDIINRSAETLKGTRFPCWKYIDNTQHGFRLGQVIGLVAGSGVGKTALSLNMFMGFVESNPDYDHFFIPLEQPVNEIADKWRTMCGSNTALYDKVHLISNYDDKGAFRHLSFTEIKDYLLKFQDTTKKKIGCVVIDHIGALRKKGANGENQDIMDICHAMKAFALETNTLLIMQSQSSRAKAGIGDLELDKDAAYGTMYFEAYCDYLLTLWQPLKRCYVDPRCPSVTALKFCKIRHKKKGEDVIQEDVPYRLKFNPTTELFDTMTEQDEVQFDFFNKMATNKRKQDRKTDLVEYVSLRKDETNGNIKNN